MVISSMKNKMMAMMMRMYLSMCFFLHAHRIVQSLSVQIRNKEIGNGCETKFVSHLSFCHVT